MENKHDSFNEKESLQLITQMIEEAKGNFGTNAIFYLIWGWLGLAASLGQYVLIQMESKWHFLTWLILMPIGGIIAFIWGRKQAKTESGYTHRLMKYVWGGFAICIFICLANGPVIGWQNAYAMLICFVGLATFISGGALNFVHLKTGGWLAWAMTAVALYTSMEGAVLSIAVVMVGSYLIPGYMLKVKYGKKA